MRDEPIPETPPVDQPATEEQTEELQTVAEQILQRTEILCQSQSQLLESMNQTQSEVSNLRQEQTNNRERLNQISDKLDSLSLTRSQSETPEVIPPTGQAEVVTTVQSVVVDPQEVRTEQPERKKKRFRAI